MSTKYRVERELMVAGQEAPTFRVIVALGSNRWGRVQVGLDHEAAHELCAKLLDNENVMRDRKLVRRPAYRR